MSKSLFDLSGRVAVVTGGTTGLGHEERSGVARAQIEGRRCGRETNEPEGDSVLGSDWVHCASRHSRVRSSISIVGGTTLCGHRRRFVDRRRISVRKLGLQGELVYLGSHRSCSGTKGDCDRTVCLGSASDVFRFPHHAGGVGEPLSEAESRAMLLLRANVLAKGFSGVRPELLELLVSLLNTGVHPVIPAKGSVGASGDLAPLAHLALVVIGEGEAFYRNERISGREALRRAGLEPLQLTAKEGLALLNGTQAMTAVGALAVARARRVVQLCDLAGAMSLEALMGTPAAFDSRIHLARPHAGQIASAAHLTRLMEGSEIRESHRDNDSRVQDAYCLRCMVAPWPME